MAAEACAIVSAIRFEEQQTLWTKDYEDSLASSTQDVFPGMMFSLARPKIEQSKLWKIAKKMPKGALLHCHLEAMVDLDWLIEHAFTLKGIHVQADGPLDSEHAQARTPFKFRWLKSSHQSTPSIWTSAYVAGTFVPIEEAADSYPHGGRDGFKALMKARSTITHDESLAHHHGPNDVWRKFQSCFGVITSLLHYEPTYRQFIRRMLLDLVEDGVRYVDIRSAFLIPFYREGSEEPDEDFEYMLGVLDDEIEDFKESEAGKTFWGARMIWTAIRHFDTRKIIESEKKLKPAARNITNQESIRYARVHCHEASIPGVDRRLRSCWTRGSWPAFSRSHSRTFLVQEDLRSIGR